jgi:hypothetical protein
VNTNQSGFHSHTDLPRNRKNRGVTKTIAAHCATSVDAVAGNESVSVTVLAWRHALSVLPLRGQAAPIPALSRLTTGDDTVGF